MHRNHTPTAQQLFMALTLCITCLTANAGVRETPHRTIARSSFTPVNAAKRLYIVQMDEAPAVAIYAATEEKERKRRRGSKHKPNRFDPNDGHVQQHVYRLQARQDRLLLHANILHNRIYSYNLAFNGFAILMTPTEAGQMRLRKGVIGVWEDRPRSVTTNYSPEFLGLFDADSGLSTDLGLQGEDIIIGIIDSGIAPKHPSVSDREQIRKVPKLCQWEWAETSFLGRFLCKKYRKPGKIVYGKAPDTWQGICQAGEDFAADDCNNKLIGARYYRDGFDAIAESVDPNDPLSAADVDGHGTHIASIAAGNPVEASIFGKKVGRLQGMAPRARVAVYKACWLEDKATRAICSLADLTMAIEDAISDGVDIINYSIGSLDYSLNDPDDLALLRAADLGIVSAVAVGNDGKEDWGTIQSPGATPWVIGVGATSRTGTRVSEGLRVNQPESIAANYESKEASFTPRLSDGEPITAQLILANDGSTQTDSDAVGTVYDGCNKLTNSSEITGNIAYIQRGGCDFDVKVSNAQDAGAIAVIVFSNDIELITMAGDSTGISIPAVMIGQADGQLIRDKLLTNNTVEITLDKSILITFKETGNLLSAFSGRGPDPDFLKPDVVAPGVAILGAHSRDVANGFRGEDYQYLSGTSQAAPHVAGIAALIKEAHPDWSVAEIKSALMTTARQNILLDDNATETNPFDIGAGHIVPNKAVDPGLLFDTATDPTIGPQTNQYYLFLCTEDLYIGDTVDCQALLDSHGPLEAKDINLPSLLLPDLVNEDIVTREVRNHGAPATYQAVLDIPAGIGVEVTPDSLVMGTDDTLEYTIHVTGTGSELNNWLFGSLTWVSPTHEVYTPFAVRPSYFEVPENITGTGTTGTATMPVSFGYDGSYMAETTGLYLPCVLPDNNLNDSICTNTTTRSIVNAAENDYDYTVPASAWLPTGSVQRFTISVPAEDNLHLRVALYDELTDGDDDLDLVLWYCAPEGQACDQTDVELAGYSRNEDTSDEQIDVDQFDLLAGTYLIDVHGYKTDELTGGEGAKFRLYVWSFGAKNMAGDNDVGNLSITGIPAFAAQNTTVDMNAEWLNLPDGLWLGGITHSTDGETIEAVTIVEADSNHIFP
ncbi:MAG: S8 family serine peptidase [Gammaproteobacteria bacterium]|nr:S8 family serine peptidase [Gammaproteobacteria bacterium]MCP4832548.1 S8 family serine peptidase [Gammaproteobacteria bacterium]MCP4928670.1 S8 family serine peptidase [Gammaproteobacteria bacterium]